MPYLIVEMFNSFLVNATHFMASSSRLLQVILEILYNLAYDRFIAKPGRKYRGNSGYSSQFIAHTISFNACRSRCWAFYCNDLVKITNFTQQNPAKITS